MSDYPAEQADVRTQIATEMLHVHETSFGASAQSVTVHLLDDLVLVFLDDLEISLTERTLLDGGDAETVLKTRAAFQRAIEPTFSAIVERATGRRVASFLSSTSLADAYSVEMFRLQPVTA